MPKFNVGVVGGCGLMGRGIAIVLLQYLGTKKSDFHLFIVDVNTTLYAKTKEYLRKQLIRFAEKKIHQLRELYKEHSELISNEEVINYFVNRALNHVSFSNDVSSLSDAEWIFEAIIEDIDEKVGLFQRIKHEALIFSNTSSIPIHFLAESSGKTGQMVGYHFYNPPHINRLVEVVIPPQAKKHEETIHELSKELNRIPIESADIAGFIGNGIFIPEVAFACQLLEEYSAYEIDQVTEKLLLRPMGIFRLVEFVGVKTVLAIAKIMEMDVHQIEGLFPMKEEEIDLKIPSKLFAAEDKYSDLARRFLLHSRLICEQLVKRGVAKNLEDVDTVLQKGFGHPYGSHEKKNLC